jgi:G protein beta subunit-like protein
MSSVVLATAGYDHTIRFWEAPNGHCHRTLQYPDSQVNKLEVTPDKKLIAAAGNPHIRLFDVNSSTSHAVLSFDGHTHNVTSVGFPKDSRWMFTGSEDGTIKIWDLRAAGCQRDYENKAPVNTVTLTSNQGELISGDENGVIHVWDLTSNSCIKKMTPQDSIPIRSITTASDGSIGVAANNAGNCFVWSLSGPAPSTADQSNEFIFTNTFQAHDGYVLKCVLSPDVRLLATTSSDKLVKIWNVSDFSLEKTLQAHQRWVWDCVFSVDSAYLVTASSDSTARLWDVAKGETIRSYTGHTKALTCVALSDTVPEQPA